MSSSRRTTSMFRFTSAIPLPSRLRSAIRPYVEFPQPGKRGALGDPQSDERVAMSFADWAGLLPQMTADEGPRPVGQDGPPATPPRAPRSPPPNQVALVLVLGGPIARSDIPGLCERARPFLEAGDTGPVVCDVAAVVEADAVTVDALARLQLTARRSGLQL